MNHMHESHSLFFLSLPYNYLFLLLFKKKEATTDNFEARFPIHTTFLRTSLGQYIIYIVRKSIEG